VLSLDGGRSIVRPASTPEAERDAGGLELKNHAGSGTAKIELQVAERNAETTASPPKLQPINGLKKPCASAAGDAPSIIASAHAGKKISRAETRSSMPPRA
jgi:hypothetical protein